LIGWGLLPNERPQASIEYRELVERYTRDAVFQQLVEKAAGGLQCRVLSCGPHGILLVPGEDSPVALKPADFRGNMTTDGRLLDGLIQVAIASTVFPRAADMLEDPSLARPELTVTAVIDTLDAIATRLREAAKGNRDPDASAEAQGLLDAWRVYDRMPKTRMTEDGRAANATVRRQVELNLERLREFGAFTRTGDDAWRSTYRYQKLVQDYAYSPILDALQDLRGLPEYELPTATTTTAAPQG
jgi:hypothetical protein